MSQATQSHQTKQKKAKNSFFLNEFDPDFTPQQKSWRPLHLLNLYRLLISGIFVSLIFSNIQLNPFGSTYLQLFQITSFAYLTGSILIGITIRWRWPALWLQTHLHIIFDFCIIILIMHSSGGVKNGVGLLLLLPVAAISILSFGRSSIFYAAALTLALFFDQTYLKLALDISPTYAQTGLLGAVLFITALITNYLVNKSEESIEIASQREVDLADMEQLTQFIMQRMQTAVIVVDYLGNIKLVNDTAKAIFKLTDKALENQTNLYDYSLELGNLFHNWKVKKTSRAHNFIMNKKTPELDVKFANLSDNGNSGTVIFLQDRADLTQQAQQLKLASLGRLSASIAHELRNPLAAIRHAGELLSESPSIESTDKRLTEIIEKQSIRINNIVGTVLDLSHRQKAEQETINLPQWIYNFLDEYIQLPQERFYLKFISDDLDVLFDPQHLQQILNNLIQNALRHTIEVNNHFRPIMIIIDIDAMNNTPYLQVMNYGKSIPKDDLDKIFEPFFTTEVTGTGLGLYIAREMASCNFAKLETIEVKGGSCFQLTFSDLRRMI